MQKWLITCSAQLNNTPVPVASRPVLLLESTFPLIVRPNRNCIMIMNLYLTMHVRRFYARGGHLALISHYELWESWMKWRVLYIIGLQRSAIFLSFQSLLCNSFVSINCFCSSFFTHFPSDWNGCCLLVMAVQRRHIGFLTGCKGSLGGSLYVWGFSL